MRPLRIVQILLILHTHLNRYVRKQKQREIIGQHSQRIAHDARRETAAHREFECPVDVSAANHRDDVLH